LSAHRAAQTRSAAARRKALARKAGKADSADIAHAFNAPKEPLMHTSLSARLASLSIATVMTLFMLVSINTLASHDTEAAQGTLAAVAMQTKA
jgi:hypothetical protein